MRSKNTKEWRYRLFIDLAVSAVRRIGCGPKSDVLHATNGADHLKPKDKAFLAGPLPVDRKFPYPPT
jgi:hypothetical protein